MPYSSWRGMVGVIKPTRRPGSLEELVRMLPDGIGVLPLMLDIRAGTLEEFRAAIPRYEAMVADLAGDGADLIVCCGAPPFMLLGPREEARLVRRWERRYKTPIQTHPMTHVAALRAVGARSFVGASYSALQNEIVVRYMREAGFAIADMKPLDVPFHEVGRLSPETVYAHIKRMFLAAGGADAVYLQGGGWRIASIIEPLERDLGVPVVHAVAADCWHIQRHLRVRAPRAGYGRLLAELPG
jgi:maleate isomerase